MMAMLRAATTWAWLYGFACSLVILIQPKMAVPFLVIAAFGVALVRR